MTYRRSLTQWGLKLIMQSKIADEVYKQLKHSIASGDLQSGKKLPSERDLADQFAVNRAWRFTKLF